jgi:hypothetical protein
VGPPSVAPADTEAPPEAAGSITAPPGEASEPPAVQEGEGESDAAGSTESGSAEVDASDDEEHFDFSDLQAEASDEVVSGPKLDIYGFADFTYTRWVKNAVPGTKPSFAVGNLNAYLSADLGSNWRSLAEVRFLYLPNGTASADDPTGPPTDTTVADYADIQRPLRWGGVEIERVWLEYTFDQLLAFRAGQWLTPYGIWNVDHGSPAIIGAYRPYIIGESLFPERQTGLQLLGSGYLGEVKVGYNLTLSNGRGPTDAFADTDANKAVGGRLFMENSSSLGDIALGASGYVGRYTNSQLTLGPAGFVPNVLESYQEVAYAGDAKWDYAGLHLQSEVVVQEVTYDDDHRPSDAYGRPGLLPDYRRWGGYLLVGYRTPLFGIMPYVNVEYYHDGPNGYWGKVPAYWLGLNARPVPSVVLKAQYLYVDPKGGPAFGDIKPFAFVTTQAAWSF